MWMTTVVGLIQDDEETHYREEVKPFVDWCRSNNLLLNVEKTKELVIDFLRKWSMHTPLYIKDTAVEIVQHIKFLGVHVTNNLTWSLHTSCSQKGSPTPALPVEANAHLSPSILTTFYKGTTESVLTSSITQWH